MDKVKKKEKYYGESYALEIQTDPTCAIWAI